MRGRWAWIVAGGVVVVVLSAVWVWRANATRSYTAGTTHAAILKHSDCVWEVDHRDSHWMAVGNVPGTWGPDVHGRLRIITDSAEGVTGPAYVVRVVNGDGKSYSNPGVGSAYFEASGTRVLMRGGRNFIHAVNCGISSAN